MDCDHLPEIVWHGGTNEHSNICINWWLMSLLLTTQYWWLGLLIFKQECTGSLPDKRDFLSTKTELRRILSTYTTFKIHTHRMSQPISLTISLFFFQENSNQLNFYLKNGWTNHYRVTAQKHHTKDPLQKWLNQHEVIAENSVIVIFSITNNFSALCWFECN